MPSATNTTTTTAPPPHTLTLPHAVIATLAPSAYLLAHLHPSTPSTPPTRPSNRTPSTFRPPTCATGSLTHCAGSAVVRVGDTAVVCGIQAEILLARDIADPPRDCTDAEQLARLQLLVPNVELATGCSPSHLPGGPPSGEAQVLVQRVNGLLHSSGVVEVEDLRIKYVRPRAGDEEDEEEEEEKEDREESVAYWTLYASIHVLSLSGSSSLIDVAWAALLAALKDVRLPKAWWDADLERVVCSDRLAETRKLQLRGRPICCTWGVFVAGKTQIGMQSGEEQDAQVKTLKDGSKAWLLADPDDFEDPLCRETITLTVDASTATTIVLRVEKSGGGVLAMQDMKQLIGPATKRWKEWTNVLG